MQLDRLLRHVGVACLALVVLAVLFFPSDAYAWGPLAHLSFSAQALSCLSATAPSTQALLKEFANEFLYGSLAADIVVGKNWASFIHHCHNWRVGFNVLRQAKPGAEKAFGLGFLAHLAADTVAHNYYVPFKMVESFHKARTRHTYWELRYDQVMDSALVPLARRVSSRRYRGHDEMLRHTLKRGSILPFDVSRSLFGSILATARARHFQRFSRFALARERNLVLEPDLVEETNRLAVQAILELLCEGERCRAASVDAIGARSIRLATALRKKLAKRAGSASLSMSDAHGIALELRPVFRSAIQSEALLPMVVDKLAA